MVEQDYTDFSNFAFDLRKQAEAFFAQMGGEQVYQLAGVIRNELATCPNGKLEPAYDFLAAILAEEVVERKTPKSNVVQMPRSFPDGIPF
jgi:hypothetical protein